MNVDNIEVEDICDKLHTLIDIVGMKKFLEITRLYGGSRIYIPTYTNSTRLGRNREIIKKYNGFNMEELSQEYKVTVNHIRRIIYEGEL